MTATPDDTTPQGPTLAGKVALITGAARGQGRSHAVALAQRGADIIAIDICRAASNIEYAPATRDDLDETARLVEALGRRVSVHEADVRSTEDMDKAVTLGVDDLGGIDVVVANAGVLHWSRLWEMADDDWNDVIDVNLTGVFKTLRAAGAVMIEQGRGGSIVITSSVAGIRALPGQSHYSASKHGVVGLMKAAAIEFAPFDIRVNAIHPWGVDTPMGELGPAAVKLIGENPSYMASFNQLLSKPFIATPQDISDAVVFLASPSSRMVTGISLPIDSGATVI